MPHRASHEAARPAGGGPGLRTVAHHRLPPAVPALCRGAAAGADVASRLPRLVQRRRAVPAADGRAAGARRVGRGAGDVAPGARGLPGRRPSRDGVQRPTLRPGAHAAGGAASRPGRLGGASGALAGNHHDTGRPPAHRLPRPGRRATGRGVRARARVRARPAPASPVAPSHVDRAQDHRQLLHAARGHRLPRAAHAGPAGRRPAGGGHPQAARHRSGDGQRRIPRGGVPLSRRTRRAGAGGGRRVDAGRHRRGGPGRSGAGRSPNSVSTGSIAIPPRCSSRGCRCG